MLSKKIKPVLIKLEGKELLSSRYLRSTGFLLARLIICIVGGWLSYLIAFVFEPRTNFRFLGICFILVLSVFGFLCSSLVLQGEEAWHCCLSNKREPSFRHVVYWLLPSRGVKSFVLNLILITGKLFWYFLFSVPGGVLILLSIFLIGSQEKVLSVISLSCGCLSIFIGLFFAFIINQRYFLAKYLVVKYPNKHIKDALSESVDIMNGICLRTAVFKLSFFPLFVACLTGFPVVFAAPYLKQSCVVLKREIIESSF